ncbi:hypothetical protein [Halalkalibacter krulwichiae]|uniref:Uncharacterized protein n=1 Tax=Halalkalibacter krulwichiae TaxID=199441 RepID=A0A1X9MBP7_9BACI|nr:hypothetical protein [Halalkalibacter krulwichiae]ARK30818.1 hypothetical protein BkAM31D_13760 [Halalkalibacter krulwichiae]
MIEYDLALDEPRETDARVEVESVLFIYDQKASDEVGQFIKIDFVPSQGLKLLNANQTLAYALQMKRV